MSKIQELKKFFASKKVKTVEDYQNAIKAFGLVNDPTPDLYGVERSAMLENRNDLAIYQTPAQFANLLKFLEDFDIGSYTEIGVFRGGTFLFMKHFLQAKNKAVILKAVDPTDFNLHDDAKPEVEPYLIKGTSDNLKGLSYDCVLIDGDHSDFWCNLDYDNVGQHAKICIFHDITEPSCPAVETFWNKLKEGKRFVEFTETIGGGKHQGIGVLY